MTGNSLRVILEPVALSEKELAEAYQSIYQCLTGTQSACIIAEMAIAMWEIVGFWRRQVCLFD